MNMYSIQTPFVLTILLSSAMLVACSNDAGHGEHSSGGGGREGRGEHDREGHSEHR